MPVLNIPLVGLLSLAGRVVGLGLERPLVKALGQGRNSYAATTVYFGIGELLLVPFVAWQALSDPTYFHGIDGWILQAAVTAVIYAISFHAYVWAMGVGEVSFLAPLFGTSFVFLYILDISFGDAQFTLLASIGILAVTAGVVFLNIAPGLNLAQVLNPLTALRQPGAWGMLVYAFGLATGRMVDKSAADVAPPLAYALLNNSLSVLGGLAILGFTGKLSAFSSLVRERFGIALVGAVAGMGAYVLLLVALDYFNPSVVEPVTQLSVLIAVWLGGRMFGERTGLRWVAALLVIAGAALLMLG
jgi:transporter family protein